MNILKKQGVAWVITAVLILIGIGLGRTSAAPTQRSYVLDEAGILSSSEEKALDRLNDRLLDSMGVVIGCVTSSDGRSDIYTLALEYAEQLELEEFDFIIVVDMSSMQYILVQGAGLTELFTDRDCEEYADRCLAQELDRGRYGNGFLSLAEELSRWYEAHYEG